MSPPRSYSSQSPERQEVRRQLDTIRKTLANAVPDEPRYASGVSANHRTDDTEFIQLSGIATRRPLNHASTRNGEHSNPSPHQGAPLPSRPPHPEKNLAKAFPEATNPCGFDDQPLVAEPEPPDGAFDMTPETVRSGLLREKAPIDAQLPDIDEVERYLVELEAQSRRVFGDSDDELDPFGEGSSPGWRGPALLLLGTVCILASLLAIYFYISR